MPDTGLTEEYIHKLRTEYQRHANKMANGHPKTFEEYKEQVGFCKGLQQAEHLLHETIKMYTDMQDD